MPLFFPPHRSRIRNKPLQNDGGQIVLAAMLGLIPMLVLVLSFLNTSFVTQDRVQKQNAVDAAVLSSVTLEARGMNLISVNNISMTYLLGEAIAGEAFLRSLDNAIHACDVALAALRSSCYLASIFGGGAAACSLIPVYEWERRYLDALRTPARSAIPPICSIPGDPKFPSGGVLFNTMKVIEGTSEAIAATSIAAESVAISMAIENGSQGAQLFPAQFRLPVERGKFRDLGDPTRYGSRTPDKGFSPAFQRGYTPILGLPWNEGPLWSAATKYRALMVPAFLVGGPWIYDNCVDNVYCEWFGKSRVRRRGEAIFEYDRAKQEAEHIRLSSYLKVELVTKPLRSSAPPRLEDLIRGETRFSGTGLPKDGSYDQYSVSGVSSDVDVDRSGGSRSVVYDYFYDPAADPAVSQEDLKLVAPGVWQIGETKTEQVLENGETRYRHSVSGLVFQMGFKAEGPDSRMRQVDPDEAFPLPGYVLVERLPRPHLLTDVKEESDIPKFRKKTYTLAVAWDQPASIFAKRFFGVSDDRRIAYSQAEIYNGTSWDLFTQDWKVRLVPASLIEEGDAMGPTSISVGQSQYLGSLGAVPQEWMKWVNNH